MKYTTKLFDFYIMNIYYLNRILEHKIETHTTSKIKKYRYVKNHRWYTILILSGYNPNIPPIVTLCIGS